MEIEPNNVESGGTPIFDTYKTKEFKERLGKEGLYVVTVPLDNMGEIE